MCQRDFLFGSVLPSIRSMLKLDKLEINGFKSFYDPVQLSFPVALTAVVGEPNTSIHENKSLTCNLRRGRLGGRDANRAPAEHAHLVDTAIDEQTHK